MMGTKGIFLDLYCGGGGAAKGYHDAGFQVVGIDIVPQPKYPFEFIQGDALDFARQYGPEFDAIHASPPCKGFSSITRTAGTQDKHPRMIAATREVLQSIERPYVIENVPGARRELINPLMLCGTMFGLLVIRHRYFECNPPIWWAPATCRHDRRVAKHGRPPKENEYAGVSGHFSNVSFAQEAMGIDWLGQKELALAIPPAYTYYIGSVLEIREPII
jgi:DNA (cytosine-5)-methyltransferase 1